MNILNIVKLHATESTNDYLKLRFRESVLPQFYTVVTINQTAGKGQMGSGWESEPGKNLTFSMFLKNDHGLNAFEVNKLTTVILASFLNALGSISVKIKWPNDILSVDKKIAGVLIENSFVGTLLQHSIIGVGLNVNQKLFKNLPHASSLKNITGESYDLDAMLSRFISYFKTQYTDPAPLISKYEDLLYGYLEEKTFEIDGVLHKATVNGTDEQGRLKLLMSDNKTRVFNIKELSWLY
jgi:BirA family biotin operon repressor/biotin-[acetyl-CoA-carboxylase] ligase